MHSTQLNQLTLGAVFMLGLGSLSLAGFTLPQPSQSTESWEIKWTSADVNSELKPVAPPIIQTRAIKTRTRIRDKLPSDVATTAQQFSSCGVEPSVFLAVAWHERGGKHGWYDDYLFGYGAYDHGNWGQKFKGWKNQWSFASRKICNYFKDKAPSINAFQYFAKDVYKTTDWQNYRNAYLYHLKFKELF